MARKLVDNYMGACGDETLGRNNAQLTQNVLLSLGSFLPSFLHPVLLSTFLVFLPSSFPPFFPFSCFLVPLFFLHSFRLEHTESLSLRLGSKGQFPSSKTSLGP